MERESKGAEAPMVIVGAGRIGGALAARAAALGIPARLCERGRGWEALEGPAGSPIVVAVRNDDLEAVLARVPEARRGDLVFVQNGMLDPWLEGHGLSGNTRGLLYFAVERRGGPIEPGAASPFVGRHAAAVVRWLGALGVPAVEVDAAAFAAAMLEKLIWNAAFGLLCQAHGATVGEVCERHAGELGALCEELAAVGRAALGVELATAPLCERLCAYSRSIPGYRGAVKEWRWRNGWFAEAAAAHGVATPIHARLLDACGLPSAAR